MKVLENVTLNKHQSIEHGLIQANEELHKLIYKKKELEVSLQNAEKELLERQ